MSFRLALLEVLFSAKGVEELKKTFGSVKDSAEKVQAGVRAMGQTSAKDLKALDDSIKRVAEDLKAAERAAKGFGGETVSQMGKAFEETKKLREQLRFLNEERKKSDGPAKVTSPGSVARVASGAAEVTGTVAASIGNAANVATISLLGLAKAGFAQSTHGAALGAQFQRLEREIASLFIPEMNRLISAVAKAADWLHNLTGGQQRQLAHVIEGIAATGVAHRAIHGLTGPVKGLGVGLMATGPHGLAAGAALQAVAAGAELVVPAMTGLLASTDHGRAALTELAEGAGELLKAIEPLTEIFTDSLVGATEMVADVLRGTAGLLKDFGTSIGELVGAVWRATKWILSMIPATGSMMAQMGMSVAEMAVSRGHEARETAKKKAKGGAHMSVVPQAGGPEAITATITRLQQASLRQDYQREMAKDIKRIADFFDKREDALDKAIAEAGKPDNGQGFLSTGGAFN